MISISHSATTSGNNNFNTGRNPCVTETQSNWAMVSSARVPLRTMPGLVVTPAMTANCPHCTNKLDANSRPSWFTAQRRGRNPPGRRRLEARRIRPCQPRELIKRTRILRSLTSQWVSPTISTAGASRHDSAYCRLISTNSQKHPFSNNPSPAPHRSTPFGKQGDNISQPNIQTGDGTRTATRTTAVVQKVSS